MGTGKRQSNQGLPPETDEGPKCHIQLLSHGYPVEWVVSGDQTLITFSPRPPRSTLAAIAERVRVNVLGSALLIGGRKETATFDPVNFDSFEGLRTLLGPFTPFFIVCRELGI
jgi:hypothetical protein